MTASRAGQGLEPVDIPRGVGNTTEMVENGTPGQQAGAIGCGIAGANDNDETFTQTGFTHARIHTHICPSLLHTLDTVQVHSCRILIPETATCLWQKGRHTAGVLCGTHASGSIVCE